MPYTNQTPAPDGWRWTRRPTSNTYNEWEPGQLSFPTSSSRTLEGVERRFQALLAWSIQWECLIQDYGGVESAGNGIHVVRVVNVYPEIRTQQHHERYWPKQWCRHGFDHGEIRTNITCNHGPTTEHLVDRSVDGRTSVVAVVWTPEVNEYRDANNVVRCPQPVTPEEVVRRRNNPRYASYRDSMASDRLTRICGKGVLPQFNSCTDCIPRIQCARCEGQFPEGFVINDNAGDGRPRCNNCWTYNCTACNTWFETQCLTVEGQDGYFCSACRLTINAERYEEFDPEVDDVPAAVLALANDRHRPVRMCSIEMETVEGGSNLARVLAGAGLAEYGEVLGYHSSAAISPNYFCHVERDSSIGSNGGELVFDRIRLDEKADVEKLHQAMGLVRQQIKGGQLQVSLACGLHIHVDAHQFGVGDVRNLVLVTNYLEDVLYRLSAAKYKRHRGTGHAIPLLKGPYTTKRDFGVHFFNNNEHHSALNVTPYWEAMRSRCTCGAALIGEHESCNCNLGKCTFEFRYFNGTANFRKVHAYAALCQSLVSYAKLVDDLTDTDFPPQEYDGRHVGAGAAKKDKWDERLRWMLANLYFAPNERESFLYCVKYSALAELGEPRIEAIFETQYVAPDKPDQTITHRNPKGAVLSDITFPSPRRRRGY